MLSIESNSFNIKVDRKLWLLSLAVILCLCFSTLTQAKTFKIATLTPNGSKLMKTMKAAAKDISRQTDKRVRFRFYPGGVMGNDSSVLKKIRIGQLHGAVFSGGAFASVAPDTQVYNIPMLFNSYEEIDYVRQHIDKKLEKRIENAGFVDFGLMEGGFAYIMSKEPISSVSDLRKNKIWAPSDDPASFAAAEAYGFSAVPLAIGDVLTGLQTGMINTVTSSPAAAIALQWHTSIHYITNIPVTYFYMLMAIDAKAFQKLSEPDQKIVESVMRKAFKDMNSVNRQDNKAAFAALKNNGAIIVIPHPEQMKTWQNKTRKAAEIYIEQGKIDSKLLENIYQLLEDFRAHS